MNTTWRLIEQVFTADLDPVGEPRTYPLLPEASATPCYVRDGSGALYLAHKDGAPDYPIIDTDTVTDEAKGTR